MLGLFVDFIEFVTHNVLRVICNNAIWKEIWELSEFSFIPLGRHGCGCLIVSLVGNSYSCSFCQKYKFGALVLG